MSTKKNRAEFVLQHGWGLSSSCWEGWKNKLGKNFIVSIPDRGYFGDEKIIKDFKTSSEKILVSHSFGLFLFEKSLLEKADSLIIISGFTKFHPEEKREVRRTRLLMKFMQKKLKLEPEKLLIDFYNGHDLRGNLDSNPDVFLLAKDLEQINTQTPDIESIKKIKNILIIHGAKDMVVPLSRAAYLKDNLFQAEMVEFEDGDHALPFVYENQVIEKIFEFLGFTNQ
ncbi:MAG: alpha/beta hydrolase [Desulforegulaceae bacterium]|nr:alpha/beta hydrolase [Desulforegulaceae bacterium]